MNEGMRLSLEKEGLGGRKRRCLTVDQANSFPLEETAGREGPALEQKNRAWKEGAAERNLYVIVAAIYHTACCLAESTQCNLQQQQAGGRGVWAEAEPGKGGGKAVFPKCVRMCFRVFFCFCFPLPESIIKYLF